MRAVRALVAALLALGVCVLPGPGGPRLSSIDASTGIPHYGQISITSPTDGEPMPSVFQLLATVTCDTDWVVLVRAQGRVVGSSAVYRGFARVPILVDTKPLRDGSTAFSVELRVASGPSMGRLIQSKSFRITVRNPRLRILEADDVGDHVRIRLESRSGDFFYMVWATKEISSVPQLWLGPFPTGCYLPILGGYVNVPAAGIWPSRGTLIDVVLRPPYYPGKDAMATPTWFMLVTFDGLTWGHSIPRMIRAAR